VMFFSLVLRLTSSIMESRKIAVFEQFYKEHQSNSLVIQRAQYIFL
jgi:hypothetical protein